MTFGKQHRPHAALPETAWHHSEHSVSGSNRPLKAFVHRLWVCHFGSFLLCLSGAYHAFDFQKYAARYLAAFSYPFNRRFDLHSLHQRLLIAAVSIPPQPMRSIRVADVCCQSGNGMGKCSNALAPEGHRHYYVGNFRDGNSHQKQHHGQHLLRRGT